MSLCIEYGATTLMVWLLVGSIQELVLILLFWPQSQGVSDGATDADPNRLIE